MHKLTPRQEAFCRHLAEGRSQRDAYIAAGYSVGTGTTAYENACRLAKNDKVSARLAELQREVAALSVKTTASLVADLDRALAIAEADRDGRAMVAAILAQARLLGLLDSDRLDEQALVPKPASWPIDVTEMSLAEWQERFGPKTPLQCP